MVLLEKYQAFYNYIYNPILTAPRKHQVFKEEFIKLLLKQFELLHEAVKSNQISRMRIADAGIASIKSYLKLCPSKDAGRRIISIKQVEVASNSLVEVGAILGKMISSLK